MRSRHFAWSQSLSTDYLLVPRGNIVTTQGRILTLRPGDQNYVPGEGQMDVMCVLMWYPERTQHLLC